MYLTSISSSKTVETLTKTRYLDALLLLHGLEKPMFALRIFISVSRCNNFQFLLLFASFLKVLYVSEDIKET